MKADTTTGGLPSGPLAGAGNAADDKVSLSNTSGGKTGIMGNMGNFSGAGTPGSAFAGPGMKGGGVGSAPRPRTPASQGTGVLEQDATLQHQGRLSEGIYLFE